MADVLSGAESHEDWVSTVEWHARALLARPERRRDRFLVRMPTGEHGFVVDVSEQVLARASVLSS